MSESEGSIADSPNIHPEHRKTYVNDLGVIRCVHMVEWITVVPAGDSRIVRVRIRDVEEEFLLSKDEAGHLASLLTENDARGKIVDRAARLELRRACVEAAAGDSGDYFESLDDDKLLAAAGALFEACSRVEGISADHVRWASALQKQWRPVSWTSLDQSELEREIGLVLRLIHWTQDNKRSGPNG